MKYNRNCENEQAKVQEEISKFKSMKTDSLKEKIEVINSMEN